MYEESRALPVGVGVEFGRGDGIYGIILWPIYFNKEYDGGVIGGLWGSVLLAYEYLARWRGMGRMNGRYMAWIACLNSWRGEMGILHIASRT